MLAASSYATVGQEIPTLVDWRHAWELAQRFWIPTDDPDDVPPHFLSQAIHHEKRQRWASQFLIRLSSLDPSTTFRPPTDTSTTATRIHKNNKHKVIPMDEMKEEETATTTAPTTTMAAARRECESVLDRSALTRVVQAAALPFSHQHQHIGTVDRVEKEGVWVLDSLTGIYALVGRFPTEFQPPRRGTLPVGNHKEQPQQQQDPLLDAIQLLIDRASTMNYPHLGQACRALWTIQGLVARVDGLTMPPTIVFQDRVHALPFAILPCAVDWSTLLPPAQPPTSTSTPSKDHVVACQTFLQAIPFQKDVIVTRLGDQVQERRGTAWIAKEGIGALAYSGKLMPPHPVPPIVQDVMRRVEEQLELPPMFFDCALCNHYADSTAACKFHTDPEHGTMWDRTTVVVAAGSDRIFAFKPIDTTWTDWDVNVSVSEGKTSFSGSGGDKTAATVHLFSGDLVVMKENCNDDFYHAVYSGLNDDPRVSLVLKRAMGRGHGLAGQGKRRRSKRFTSSSTTTTTSPSSSRPTTRSPPAESTTKMRKTSSSGRGGRNNVTTGGSKR